jgi:hypothetical protein
MPSPDSILASATAIANDWRLLAIGWHALFAVLLAALLAGWRPPARRLAALLSMPFVSVSALAWISGNPFNGAVFAVLAGVLFGTSRQVTATPVAPPTRGWLMTGAALIAFGWLYPHFLVTSSWLAYAYAAPLGLLPCPTLTLVIGVALISDGLRTTRWSMAVAVVGLLYGVIGLFVLGVTLDAGLLAGASILATAIAHDRSTRRPARAAQEPAFHIDRTHRPTTFTGLVIRRKPC